MCILLLSNRVVSVLAAAKMQYPKIMYHALDKHVLSDDTKPETINHMSKYTRESSGRLQAARFLLLCIPSQVHPNHSMAWNINQIHTHKRQPIRKYIIITVKI